MRSKVFWAAAVALGAGSTAHAQFGLFPAGGRVEVSAGGFTPSSAETRADDTSTWFRLGINVALGKGIGPVRPFAYFDLAGQAGRVVDTDTFFELRRSRSMASVGAGYAVSARIPGTRWAVDASAGAGLTFLTISDDYTPGDNFSGGAERVLARATNVGTRLRVAVREPRGFFLEAAHLTTGQLRGLDYRGFSIAVGKRF